MRPRGVRIGSQNGSFVRLVLAEETIPANVARSIEVLCTVLMAPKDDSTGTGSLSTMVTEHLRPCEPRSLSTPQLGYHHLVSIPGRFWGMADDELCTVVGRRMETKDLDYKGPCAWDETDKRACCEIVKDILAMANTLGGYLVIGVSEVDGRLSFDGLTAAELRTWDTTRVNRFLQNYADPPINVTLQKPQCDGKEYVVLTVPRFSDTPHLCQRDYERILHVPGLYVRSDNNESVLIRDSADFRSIVEHAIRNRQNQMLEAMRAIMTGASVTPTRSDREQFNEQAELILAEEERINPYVDQAFTGYWLSRMYPAKFDPQRFNLAELRKAASIAEVNYRTYPFLWYHGTGDLPKAVDDGLRLVYARSPWGQAERYDFWALKQSGLFIQKTMFLEDGQGIIDSDGKKVIDPNSVIYYVTEAIDVLVRLYSELGVSDEDVIWEVVMFGTSGRRLKALSPERSWWARHYIAESESITWQQTHPVEEWRAGHLDLAVATCRELFSRFQWDNPDDQVLRDWMKKLLDRKVR